MSREHGFSDEDGRSLAPDLDDGLGLSLPVAVAPPVPSPLQNMAFDPEEPSLSAPASIREQSHMRSPKNAVSERTSVRAACMSPGDRFRRAVRKIIALRRGVGAEPGIDPRRQSAFLTYGHVRQNCLIEIADYSSVRSSFRCMTNSELIRLLADTRASAKEPWVKVRWINVGGISWDVISALAIKYDMHPLAIEDLLHTRRAARSKADYYQKHLFLRILCHTLTPEEETATPDGSVTQLPRSSSPEHYDDSDNEDSIGKDDEDRTVYGSNPSSRFATARMPSLRTALNRRVGKDVELQAEASRGLSTPPTQRFSNFGDLQPQTRAVARNAKLIRELTRGERVNVKISPMCIFLFRDGTVVTIHQDNKLDVTKPIRERLRLRDTGLRQTADASMLVQSLIDLIVDQALEVVEEYQSRILKLERAVLLKPSMKHVRRLHILQGDLILHKRTLEPIKTLVYGLRRYDVDRVAALSEVLDPAVEVQGYMSHKAKIYLADVHDHMEYILSSLDMFAGISENLINYTFNMSSYHMGEVMRRLTLATIIFLPLTLLTGYFGMNFNNMWTIHHGHSDVVFWIIALPLLAIIVPIFLWSDLGRIFRHMEKKMAQQRLKKKLKQA